MPPLLLLLLACTGASEKPDATDTADTGDTDTADTADTDTAGTGTDIDDTADPCGYVDADGDGHGDPARFECAGPVVAAGDDCDDGDAALSPSAPETCDGRDDDCDTLVDDADDSLEGAPAWYADTDGDGLGDADAVAVYACVAPEGHVETRLCDGATAPWSWEDGDCDGRRGLSVGAAAHATSGPGLALSLQDLDDDGVPELFLRGEDEALGVVAGADLVAGGDRRGRPIGEAATSGIDAFDSHRWLFDADEDGRDDLFVAAPFDGTGALRGGAVHLFPGADVADAYTSRTTLLVDDASAAIVGHTEEARLSGALATVGDLDGDGVPELAAGAMGIDVTFGAVHLFSGASLAPGAPTRPADAMATVYAGGAGDFLGGARGARLGTDVDGDGIPEVMVPAPEAGPGGTLYVFDGTRLAGGAVLPAGDADASWVSRTADTSAGTVLDVGADLTGDGRADVLVAGGYYGAAAWVLDGAALLGGTDRGLEEAWLRLHKEADLHGERESMFGYALAAPGDLDGDGRGDLVATDPAYAGRVYVFAGARLAGGAVGAEDAAALFEGVDAESYAGWSVAGPGDLDGSGTDDLVVGALSGGTGGGTYVLLSRW